MISEPRYNHIDVKVTYACNFKCEYCYQVDEKGMRSGEMLSESNVDNLLLFIDRLGLKFQVTLAGGEPFVYPYLEKLAKGLAERRCYIMIITNFSAPNEKIEHFLDACGNYLKEFNISIHLSQWRELQDFIVKLTDFKDIIKRKKIDVHIGCTCVVTDENFIMVKKLCNTMKNDLPGVPLKLHRVYYNGIYHTYTKEVESFLTKNNIDIPKEQIETINFRGLPCWAGSRFFYVESDGTVYRCYTRQEKNEDWVLGSIEKKDEIKISTSPRPCFTVDSGKCICYDHFKNVGFVKTDTGCCASNSSS
jgi:MoaA/NifB/PqqE/SkfB family radical SAM enzyme